MENIIVQAPREATAEQKEMLLKATIMAPVYDPENPPLSKERLASFHWVNPSSAETPVDRKQVGAG